MKQRKRRFRSLADELIKKAREAMISAVQIFNSPQIEFKSELFTTTTIIAWTYLLHAYYRKTGVEYRQVRSMVGPRRRFNRTRFGAIKHWSLEECLDSNKCPVDELVKTNLRFLIGLRHEIEHQMTTRIDDQVSAKFQSAALNFNSYIKNLFGIKYALDREQAFSIQFAGISEDTAKILIDDDSLPKHIRSFVAQFERDLSQEEYDDPRFSYRVAFVRKTSNSKLLADKVVQMVPAGTDTAEAMNIYLRETEKAKFRPGKIVKQMKEEGFPGFRMREHTQFWQARDAKNPRYQFGTEVEGVWYWYEPWLLEVRKYCQDNSSRFAPPSENNLAGEQSSPRQSC